MSNGKQGTPTKTTFEIRQSARRYIQDQLAVMRKYGSERILSIDEYQRMENELVRVASNLWTATGGIIVEGGVR